MATTNAVKIGSETTPFSPARSPDPLVVHAAIAGMSFVAYILAHWLDGPASVVFSTLGVSACGWAWLLARSLFDPANPGQKWPRLVVMVVTVAGAVSVLAPAHSALSGIASKVYVLSGSAALLLTLIEPFHSHGRRLSSIELRFRAVFTLVFAGLAGVSVLGIWLRPEPVQIGSAILGLAGVVVATGFRLRHPLASLDPERAVKRARTEEEARLGLRLLSLLRDEAIHADPELRIGDVAARLGEPEYRISRCVGALGFANFNRLINHHRITQATRMLSSSEERRSILDIALDCGFASVGPFNRAFRAETGTTPRAFRAAASAR